LHDNDDEEWKKKAAPLDDTFIHLFKDLLSSEALHRIKRTVLGIGTIFPFLLPHSAFGWRERKDPRDMLRSLHWDEQSLFNLMFVRTSIISSVQERESLKGCFGQVEIRKYFIYISATTGNSFVLIMKLVNVTAIHSNKSSSEISKAFSFDSFLKFFSFLGNANEKRLSTFDNPFQKLFSFLLLILCVCFYCTV
jgi:hypothetical protein